MTVDVQELADILFRKPKAEPSAPTSIVEAVRMAYGKPTPRPAEKPKAPAPRALDPKAEAAKQRQVEIAAAKERQADLDAASATARAAVETKRAELALAEAKALRRRFDGLRRAEHQAELQDQINRLERRAAKRAAKGQ